jgi:hypothetical protein
MTFSQALLLRGVRFRQSAADHAKIHINCPFCPENGKSIDTQYKLCVHAMQGWGRCMHCNWKRRYAVAAVLKQLGIVADGVYAGVGAEEQSEEANVELPHDFTPLVRVYEDLDRTARDYVLKRGITPEQIKKHKIGVSYTGRYAYRVLFPIKADGKLVGINARDFTGQQEPKYLLSRGEKYIYNLDPKAKTVVLSEGVIKALKIQQATDANSGALLGHSLTDRQLAQVKASACQHVILYPDAERVGRRGFLNIACRLKEEWDGNVSIIHPVRTPADDSPVDEIRDNLRNHAHAWTTHIDAKMVE